jgi:hypothetical protein
MNGRGHEKAKKRPRKFGVCSHPEGVFSNRIAMLSEGTEFPLNIFKIFSYNVSP